MKTFLKLLLATTTRRPTPLIALIPPQRSFFAAAKNPNILSKTLSFSIPTTPSRTTTSTRTMVSAAAKAAATEEERMREITIQDTVADIVSLSPTSASVFQKYDIDFCCGGKVSLQEVCQQKTLNGTQILKELARTQHWHGTTKLARRNQCQYHY